MTQKEFEERTGIVPTPEDFEYIHEVYMNTSMDKDAFCKEFKKHGESQIIRDIYIRVVNCNVKLNRQKEVTNELADFQIGKAQAVKLVGEVEVVKRTIELGFPLWDEDRKCILSMINEQSK